MRILHIDYSHVSNASKTVMPKHNNCYRRLFLANTKDKLTIKLTTTIIIEDIVTREENHKVPNGLPIKRNPQVGLHITHALINCTLITTSFFQYAVIKFTDKT